MTWLNGDARTLAADFSCCKKQGLQGREAEASLSRRKRRERGKEKLSNLQKLPTNSGGTQAITVLGEAEKVRTNMKDGLMAKISWYLMKTHGSMFVTTSESPETRRTTTEHTITKDVERSLGIARCNSLLNNRIESDCSLDTL